MDKTFFGSLGSILQNQFASTNPDSTLNSSTGGVSQAYGKLGEFASKFDQTSERRYLQEGFYKTNYFTAVPKQLEILFQEPDATIVVKKRAFSSLAENTRVDYMDEDERLFYKATQILFQNKTEQISAFEKLSKIERVAAETGSIDSALFPMLVGLTDFLKQQNTELVNNQEFNKFDSVIDKIRQVLSFSKKNFTTTWLKDGQSRYGTGVIELTNFTSFDTTVSTSLTNSAGGTLSLVDPYNMMTITNFDIEKALADASNHNIFQLGLDMLQTTYSLQLTEFNKLRSSRGASAISIKLNPNSVFGKKVQIILDRLGYEIIFKYNLGAVKVALGSFSAGEVEIADSAKIHSMDLGEEGLTDIEIKLLGSLIKESYKSFQIRDNTIAIAGKNSQSINYARKKLRLHYGNKLIIQPMDQIHIFVNSKSRLDTKILGGLQNSFSGFGFLQQFNNLVDGFQTQIDSIFGMGYVAQVEKSLFVGSDFPNYLWSILRNNFVNDKEGTHIFAGLINGATLNYNDGNYTVRVNFGSNAEFFKLGYLNVNPGVDNFLGPLFDPLTPFEIKKDSDVSTNFSNENLEPSKENKKFLAEKIAKLKNGPGSGETADEKNIGNDINNDGLGINKNIYYAPDGFVYKWKEGISTYVYSGDSFSKLDPNTNGVQPITNDPFAGQDTMNVISLLITGLPYNFNTYFKAATEFGGAGEDPITKQKAVIGYYKSLTDKLKTRNLIWGNFIPFKSLSVDEKKYSMLITGQAQILKYNEQLNALLATYQEVSNVVRCLTESQQGQLGNKLTLISSNIDELQGQIALENSINNYTIIGNDVSFDSNEFLNINNKKISSQSRKELRKKINFLTRRLSWQTRANTDRNLFIVDDNYDKDYDIMAFDKSLSANTPKLFSSENMNTLDQINTARKVLDLEVFFDTQGHIRARPPQYNRIPSSVFYKMIQLKNDLGIELYPSYLESLFEDQLFSAIKNIEVIEDLIRADGLAISLSTDQKIIDFLGNAGFSFISDEDGKINIINNILKLKDPDDNDQISSFTSKLNNQLNIRNLFGSVKKAEAIKNILKTDTSLLYKNLSSINDNDYFIKIKDRIFIKSGQQISLSDYIGTTTIAKNAGSVDIIAVTKSLESKIKTRQNLIKIAANALQNSFQIIQLNNDKSIANKYKLTSKIISGDLPDIFESILEDESYDDYGPGSGKRFIIKNEQITSYDFTETPPIHTYVEIQGLINPYEGKSGSGDQLTAFPNSGSGLTTAIAIDYDLWRMYGFKSGESIAIPFFSDPVKQSAPFAVNYLSKMRKNILHGNMTISGNEYIQPGEVYYIEDKDLLFYCESVSHSFAIGDNFSTKLTLTYGRNPGEYIPTYLDLIGKILYRNQNTSNYILDRQGTASDESNLGAIIVDTSKSDEQSIVGGKYGEENIKVLNHILYTVQFAVSRNKIASNNLNAKIEMRVYYNSKSEKVNPKLVSSSTYVKKYLTSQINSIKNVQDEIKSLFLQSSDIKDVEVVDSSKDGEHRSPSQNAISVIRDKNLSNTIKSGLYEYIIDCWLVFEQK